MGLSKLSLSPFLIHNSLLWNNNDLRKYLIRSILSLEIDMNSLANSKASLKVFFPRNRWVKFFYGIFNKGTSIIFIVIPKQFNAVVSGTPLINI